MSNKDVADNSYENGIRHGLEKLAGSASGEPITKQQTCREPFCLYWSDTHVKAERWQQISRLYHAALACEGDRAAFLKHACADDEALRLDVESMLGHQATAEAFLTSPPWVMTASTRSDPRPGDQIGEHQDQAAALKDGLADRYRIGGELGRGGMATVYLADDLKHGRKVAIKTIHAEMAATIGHQRFLREIEIAARLTHPHILPLHDSGEVNGQLYYVMPYIEGESLRVRLDHEKPFSIEASLRLTREIASALEYAHQHGVVHRDIKPGNVLLADGIALVADFGIARAVSASVAQQTPTGILVGTPQYMSPEQASGSCEVDARSDIYSLGCVLYQMLAGEPPFTGSAMAVLARHALEEMPPLKTRRSGITEGLERVVQKSLAKSAADRYPTAALFAEALGEATVPPTVSSQRPGSCSCTEQSACGAHAFHRTRNRVGRMRWTPGRGAVADCDGDRWKWEDATGREARENPPGQPSGWCVVRGSQPS